MSRGGVGGLKTWVVLAVSVLLLVIGIVHLANGEVVEGAVTCVAPLFVLLFRLWEHLAVRKASRRPRGRRQGADPGAKRRGPDL